MKEYDFIITGSGASGLVLAYRMASDAFFDQKSILIIDREKKNTNDRTWCYWEIGQGDWDDILTKEWTSIIFNSPLHSEKTEITPYSYKMLRSADLYNKLWEVIDKKSNITFVHDRVLNISHRSEKASVLTEKTEYHGKKVLNSIFFNRSYRHQNKYPVLKQHFHGWFVESKQAVFDDSTATFMDFAVDQKGNTRFMYVLPITKRKALFEYTLFSKNVLTKEEYEKEIRSYLQEKNLREYRLVEKEHGVIPMTSYKFWKRNSKNVLNIGTAGGWTKASTGYTFGNITKQTKLLVEFLKTDQSFKDFRSPTRFWFYDLLLLDILDKDNYVGSRIFSVFFRKNKTQNIFKFLDEETSFLEDIKIMTSMPPLRFIKALIKRLFSIV
jgi:lycopene beta-cyclase